MKIGARFLNLWFGKCLSPSLPKTGLYTFFFLSGFSFMDTNNSQDRWGNAGDHLLFHSTTSTPLQTFRHLFATLHVRWLSHIFDRNTCIYQTATRWAKPDWPPYRITIWLIDWWGHVDFRLFACWFDSRFCYSYFTWENGGLELASTIILVLQANRLTKCASHLLGGGFIATFVEFIEFISSFWVKWGLVCRNWKYSFGITYGQLFCCLGLIGPKLGPIDPKLVVRLQTPDLRFILIF